MTTFQQDYAPVVIGNRKSGTGGSGHGGSKQVGEKKPQSTGLNGRLDNQTAAKLDSENAKAPETIGLDVGKAIAKARNDKGWKAPDLANALNAQKGIVADLESGRHPKDNKLLQKLEGKLGVWLTRPELLGEPKTRGKKASEENKPAAKAGKAKAVSGEEKTKEAKSPELEPDPEDRDVEKDASEKKEG